MYHSNNVIVGLIKNTKQNLTTMSVAPWQSTR